MKIKCRTYAEAKNKALDFMKEEKVTGISINKKRDEDGWVLEIRECCEDFFNKYIKTY
jgi:hypothetical protein